MKLNPSKTQHQSSTQPRTFRTIAPDGYPKYIDYENDPYYDLKAPNPPTAEAVARAQFVDKTYRWQPQNR